MNASDVIAFLSGDLAAQDFQARIEPEVAVWAARLSERGRSASISLTGMQAPFDVTPQRAGVLLDAFIADEFPAASFAYVLDAILLEEKFRWTSLTVREAMEHVLGSEYPKSMDKRRAWQVRTELRMLLTN